MNAQLLTKEAQNALLKTLEEQSDRTVLVLLVNNEKSVLDTILSRCTRIYPKEQQENTDEALDIEIGRDFASKDLADKIANIDDVLKEKKEAEFVLNLMKYYQRI
jgi:DNA polymerase-3 subunit delta'